MAMGGQSGKVAHHGVRPEGRREDLRGQHLRHGPGGEDVAIQTDYVRRVIGNHGEVVADHHERQARLGLDGGQQIAKKVLARNVHAGDRFVQQNNFRVQLQRQGKLNTLQFSAGQLAQRPVQ